MWTRTCAKIWTTESNIQHHNSMKQQKQLKQLKLKLKPCLSIETETETRLCFSFNGFCPTLAPTLNLQ